MVDLFCTSKNLYIFMLWIKTSDLWHTEMLLWKELKNFVARNETIEKYAVLKLRTNLEKMIINQLIIRTQTIYDYLQHMYIHKLATSILQ